MNDILLLKKKKEKKFLNFDARGQFVKSTWRIARLGRDLCRGLNAGDRRKKGRKRKSCAGGRGNKSVRPSRLTVRVSFLLSFNFFRGQLQHWSKNEPNATFHLSADALWRNVYVFSRVETKTIDPFGHVLRMLVLSFIGIFVLQQTYAFFI